MNINWKHLATTPGYVSLKAAYIRDVKKATESKYQSMRNKAEFLRLFNWVICRAKYYAHRENVTLEIILNRWEADRDYWWLNYYQNCNQHKYPKKCVS